MQFEYPEDDYGFSGYEDANGIQHESYDAACEYYGADTPSQLAFEAAMLTREENEQTMDSMMSGIIQPHWAYQITDLPF